MRSMLGALQTSTMLRMNTGNYVLDALIGMFMAMFIGYLVDGHGTWEKIMNWAKSLVQRESRIEFTGRMYYSYSMCTQLSDRFMAVTEWMVTELMADRFRDARTMKELNLPKHLRRKMPFLCSNESSSVDDRLFDNGIMLLDQQYGYVKHRHQALMVNVQCVNNTAGSGQLRGEDTNAREYIEYTITISSKKWDVVKLNEYLNTNVFAEFQRRKVEAERGHLSYYMFRKRDEESASLLFDKYPWKSTKRYEHIVSEQTAVVQRRVEHFVKSRDLYERTGRPYSLTILLHGPPGCGKTSIIKAVANATRRDVVDISLPRVKTRQTLIDLFHDNCRTKPATTVFVIDELDKMGKIVESTGANAGASAGAGDHRDRGAGPNFTSRRGDGVGGTCGGSMYEMNATDQSTLLQMQLQLIAQQNGIKGKGMMGAAGKMGDEPLKLHDILNVMDGLLELDGCITFITANQPDKLHAALRRPGRIDLSLYMGNASAASLRIMLEKAYCGARNSATLAAAELEVHDRKWSPAEIEEICTNSDLDGALRCLEDRGEYERVLAKH